MKIRSALVLTALLFHAPLAFALLDIRPLRWTADGWPVAGENPKKEAPAPE